LGFSQFLAKIQEKSAKKRGCHNSKIFPNLNFPPQLSSLHIQEKPQLILTRSPQIAPPWSTKKCDLWKSLQNKSFFLCIEEERCYSFFKILNSEATLFAWKAKIKVFWIFFECIVATNGPARWRKNFKNRLIVPIF